MDGSGDSLPKQRRKMELTPARKAAIDASVARLRQEGYAPMPEVLLKMGLPGIPLETIHVLIRWLGIRLRERRAARTTLDRLAAILKSKPGAMQTLEFTEDELAKLLDNHEQLLVRNELQKQFKAGGDAVSGN